VPFTDPIDFLQKKSGFISGSYSCTFSTFSAYTDAIEAPAASHNLAHRRHGNGQNRFTAASNFNGWMCFIG
jgi:hypothetical protein